MTSLYDANTKNLFAKLENNSGYGDTYDNELTNPYVNFMNYKPTQILQDMLVAEAVQMRGIPMIYIRREFTKLDLIFGEDPLSKFHNYFQCAVYVESFDGWEGDQDWITSFGYSVNDEINVTINPGLFLNQGDGAPPTEGDLLYMPLSNSLFEINWVEPEKPWYPVGTLPMRSMKCAKFIYSGENIALAKTATDGLDSITDIFEVEELNTHIDKINGVNGLYDTEADQGAQVKQANDEANVFKVSESAYPPGPLNIEDDLDF